MSSKNAREFSNFAFNNGALTHSQIVGSLSDVDASWNAQPDLYKNMTMSAISLSPPLGHRHQPVITGLSRGSLQNGVIYGKKSFACVEKRGTSCEYDSKLM